MVSIPIPPFLWKIGAALAVCAGLLFWAYSAGYSRASDRCKAERSKDYERHVRQMLEQTAKNLDKDREIQKLLADKPASRIRDVVRENPSNCRVPDAVGNGLREAINRANAPAG